VDIEDIAGLTIEVITLTCDARCADVVAVASGGNPEYTYRWEDGSTDPHRRVCLDADAQLSVSATDTPIVTEEFSYAAKTVNADLTADVVECADAGPPDPPDPPGGPLCVKNPSFEGHAPGIGYGEAGSLADDWTVCSATPDVCPFGDPFCTLPATDGSAYLGFGWYSLDVESAGGEFCSALEPGERSPLPSISRSVRIFQACRSWRSGEGSPLAPRMSCSGVRLRSRTPSGKPIASRSRRPRASSTS
jgi:hypothetical protein